MSDVQPYVPGQTGSLSDVIERAPELAPFTPAAPDGFKPPPSFGQLFSAATPGQQQQLPEYDEIKLREGYAPIVDALDLRPTQNPYYFSDNQYARDPVLQPSALLPHRTMLDNMVDRPMQEGLIAQQIRARRAQQPDFLAGVPDNVDGLHKYFEQQQAAKRAAGAAVLARGSFGGRAAASLASGFTQGLLNDPVQLPLLAFGGGTASSLFQAAGRDALINGALSMAQLPAQAHNMAENNEHLTLGEAAGEVAGSTAFGAALGAGVHLAATHVPPALFSVMPESVQARWAARMTLGENGPLLKDVLGDMDNRELAGFARSTLGPRMTPEEKGAADALERNQELGEASPFMPGPSGDAAHNAGLAEGLKSVIDGTPRGAPDLLNSTGLGGSVSAPPLGPLDTSAAAVPHDIVDFLKGKGLDDARAYGIAAGIVAESGGDHLAVNSKSGAIGLGQWLGPRKAALLERYGPNPSRGDQLDFLWGELNGGDPGGKSVLAAKDAGQALDAYVRRFMRPAAGAETLGDLERGMAALGHKGEVPAGGGDVAVATGGDDAAAALQRQADDAEQQAIALSGEPAAAGDRGGAELDAADYPILKRELFPSDRDWFDAQLAFYRSVEAEHAPQAAGNGPSGGFEASGRPDLTQPVAETAPVAPGAPQSLRDFFGASVVADEQGRPLTVYHGSGSEFDTFDVARAGEGRGSTGERALFFSTDPEVASHSALVAGAGHATNEPTHTGAFADNGGVVYPVHLRVENPLISRLKFYNGEQFAKEIARAKSLGHDGVIFPHVTSRGENGTIAVFSPDQVRSIFADATQVRIDEPALKAFDEPGGEGAKQQTQSLEHDARLGAAVGERVAAEDRLHQAPRREHPIPAKASEPIASLVENPREKPPRGQRFTDRIKAHPDYKAAKSGDVQAAQRLVDHFVKGAELERAARELKGATFVPVIAEEESGRNMIPAALAHRYAQAAGGRIEDRILQVVRAHHTNARALDRMRSRPLFDGPVDKGRGYVLVDDNALMGGTIAELADHIQRGGGKIERVVLLGDGTGGLTAAPEILGRLEAKGFEHVVRDEFGLELGALTAAEARWVDGFRTPDRLRDHVAKQVRDGAARGAEPSRSGERGGSGEQGSRQASVSEQPAPFAGPERSYQLDEGGKPQTLSEILDGIARDRAAAKALRDCAGGNG